MMATGPERAGRKRPLVSRRHKGPLCCASKQPQTGCADCGGGGAIKMDNTRGLRFPQWQTIVAGGAAGLFNDTVLHPADTLRARLNVRLAPGSGASWESPVRAAKAELRSTLKR